MASMVFVTTLKRRCRTLCSKEATLPTCLSQQTRHLPQTLPWDRNGHVASSLSLTTVDVCLNPAGLRTSIRSADTSTTRLSGRLPTARKGSEGVQQRSREEELAMIRRLKSPEVCETFRATGFSRP